MILPNDIKTKNKIRDAKIINDWLTGITQEALALQYGVTRIAIYQIIRKNRQAIKIDSHYEKLIRIHELKRQLSKSKDSKKDKLEILEALRKEIDGDGENSSKNQVIIYNFSGERNKKINEQLTKQNNERIFSTPSTTEDPSEQ